MPGLDIRADKPEAIEGREALFGGQDHLIKIKFERQDYLINIKAI
ncbi:MAG: hypothetical protein WAK63_16140 [Xanthobacteraceae bacterium]